MADPPSGGMSVVVLGMHRSGTSVVAGILHALGVDMGAHADGEQWVGKHWSNPTGHFENPAFVALDYRILGGDATGLRGPPEWKDVASRAPEFSEEVRALVARSQGPAWGWKDPWTVLTLELFLPYLTNPRFVLVRRPREEVLASLRKRSTARDQEIADLYEVYVDRLAALRKELGRYPWFEIDYPELTRDPGPIVEALVRFLELRPSREELDRALGLVLSGAALRRQGQRMAVLGVMGFPRWVGWIVKRDLRHHPSVVPADLLRAVPKELYQMLRALV